MAKKKAKKHEVSENKPVVYNYFNTTSYQLGTIACVVQDAANEVCREVASVPCTKFLEFSVAINNKNLVKCYKNKDEHFRRFWLDKLVWDVSCSVWTTVFDTLRFTVGEHKAEKAANDASFTFRRKFI